jgi:hypothetical protein
MRGELDHLAGQQLQRPTGAAGRRARARSRHQQGFLLAAEFALRSAARLFAECCLQAAKHEAALCPVDGRFADPNAPRNLLIAGSAVRRQQDLRTLELAGRVRAAAQSSARSLWLSSTR